MQQAVILTFDDASTAIFDECARAIDPSLGPIPPHVTLCLVETDDEAGLVSAIGKLAAEIAPFPITFGSVGGFLDDTITLFAAPVVTLQLLTIHQCFTDVIDQFDPDNSSPYRPGQWVPHCTLGLHLPRITIEAFTPIVRSLRLPINGTVTGVRVVRFPVIHTLATFVLGSP